MTITYEKKDKIAYVTLNRPEVLNALNSAMLKELRSIFNDFNSDAELLVAIITGKGEKAFCAGFDLQEVSKGLFDDPFEAFWNPENAKARLLREMDIRKPVIAAVNGHCIGSALHLILDCDIRIASENASFCLPEVKTGLSARGSVILLANTIPLSLAMEMILTGDPISAEEAYRCGLVSRLVPLNELMPTAEKLAKTISENAPLAVRANKEIMKKGLEIPFDHAARLASSLAYAVQNSEDHEEGLRAFREKRKPDYKGK